MLADDNYVLAILLAGVWLSIRFKKLTVPAAITGGLCGWLVYAGMGYTGLVMMALFFVLGTAATSYNIKLKQQLKAAEANHGRRKSSQVLANAGVAALAGGLAVILPQYKPLLQLITAASFASATADTLSSELGTLYGRNFYNIITLRKDERGLDGVISLEGTLFGIAGSAVIAAVYSIGHGGQWFGWLVLCGTTGNLADSVLGALLERRNMLKNDAVNFLNTLIAAVVAWGIYVLL